MSSSTERRHAVEASFAEANARAAEGYGDERRELYARLKLEGLKEAPIHLAVFGDDATTTGGGLGQQTMPETLHYSVVGAIQTLWLAARAEGLGVGWISILDPPPLQKPSTYRRHGPSSPISASAGRPRSISTPSWNGITGRAAPISKA